MIDKPISNFQCPKCGQMSVVDRITYEKMGFLKAIFTNGHRYIESKILVCLKCNWEHDTVQKSN